METGNRGRDDIARAVAPTKDIIRWSKGFLGTGKYKEDVPVTLNERKKVLPPGSILLLKGGDLTAELDEAALKLKPKEMTLHSLIVDGVEQSEFTDKKLVVVIP